MIINYKNEVVNLNDNLVKKLYLINEDTGKANNKKTLFYINDLVDEIEDLPKAVNNIYQQKISKRT